MPTRRDVLKAGLLAPAAVAAAKQIPFDLASNSARPESNALADDDALASAAPVAGRERLLLDFGWRFHFGHADDPSKDFGFGGPAVGNFQKTGNFMPACSIAYDDSDWKSLDLPHAWAVEWPFKTDPALLNPVFAPWGRRLRGT